MVKFIAVILTAFFLPAMACASENTDNWFDNYRTNTSNAISQALEKNLGKDQSFESGVRALSNEDYTNAFKLLLERAEDGYPPAQLLIARLYFSGKGVNKDIKQALQWYQKAAEQKLGDAQVDLGVIYTLGKSVEKDEKLGRSWFEKQQLKDFLMRNFFSPHAITKV